MCLAIPMQVMSLLDNNKVLVKQGGGQLEVDVTLLGSVEVGSFVIVHAGYAIEVLDDEEAETRIDLFKALDEQQSAL